ncbi:hypothetical protein K4F52_009067 [Lecanicillium sp. MT-2017a]|nr:hypothetical protein K4F52_009067 [Lecanicillium sp. MT-2017a]
MHYSSSEFAKNWRYAVNQEFTNASGDPFPYAENGRQHWGNELTKLTFEVAPKKGAISDDGNRMAFAVGKEIHTIDTATWETTTVLPAHLSDVASLAFKPKDSNILVTSNSEDHSLSGQEGQATIFFWKLDALNKTQVLESKTLAAIGNAGVSAQSALLSQHGIEMTQDDLERLERLTLPFVKHVIARTLSKNKGSLHGRLTTSFQSNVFSPSGRWMVYLPGDSPRSNGVDVWDMKICSADDYSDRLTLTGHTDAIMWTGWNHDESLFGSVAWDKTIRIWDANTGRQLHKFETGKQNWTGGFSPDSQFFAATDGDGRVRVYALRSDNENKEHWVYEDTAVEGRKWRRALAWHPDSKLLAVGGDSLGEVLLLDIENKEVRQHRTLSFEASEAENDLARKMMSAYLGVSRVEFVGNGDKLVIWTTGDGSIEVYDLARSFKHRFARGGTDDVPEAAAWRGNDGKVTSGQGRGMMVGEDKSRGRLILASLDSDGVRVWAI